MTQKVGQISPDFLGGEEGKGKGKNRVSNGARILWCERERFGEQWGPFLVLSGEGKEEEESENKKKGCCSTVFCFAKSFFFCLVQCDYQWRWVSRSSVNLLFFLSATAARRRRRRRLFCSGESCAVAASMPSTRGIIKHFFYQVVLLVYYKKCCPKSLMIR